MIFTFPTSKTNEGFFLIEDSYAAILSATIVIIKKTAVLHSLVSQKTLRHRRKFSMLRSTLEDLTDQCCDHWMVFRSTPSCTISHNGLQWARCTNLKKKMFIEMLLCHALWLVKNFLITSSTSQMQNYTYCVRFLRLLVAFVAAFVVFFFFLRSYGLHLIIYDTGWHRQTFAVSRLHWTPETIKYTLYRLKLHGRPINKGG